MVGPKQGHNRVRVRHLFQFCGADQVRPPIECKESAADVATLKEGLANSVYIAGTGSGIEGLEELYLELRSQIDRLKEQSVVRYLLPHDHDQAEEWREQAQEAL